MGTAASSLEPADRPQKTSRSGALQRLQPGTTVHQLQSAALRSTFGSIAYAGASSAVWRLELRRICSSVRRELSSRVHSAANGLPSMFCSPAFRLPSACGPPLQWQLCLVPLELSTSSVSLYIQNVSTLQPNSGLTVTASFTMNVRSPQSTSNSASLDGDYTFGLGTTDQGVRLVIPLEDVRQLERAGFAEVDIRLHSMQIHTALPVPGIVQSTDPHITLISLQPRILLVENFLSSSQCQGIIELAQPDLHRSRVARGDMTLSRTSCSTFLTHSKAAHLDIQCFEERVSHLIALPAVMCGRRPLTKGEAVQVVRYQAGEFYAEHFDNKADDCCKRACTIMAYLSDVEAGGETFFRRSNGCPVQSLDYPTDLSASMLTENGQTGCASRPGLRVPPKKGRAIMFWSRAANGQEDRASLHSGERVQLGEKWICSRWLQEQPDCSPDDNLSIEE